VIRPRPHGSVRAPAEGGFSLLEVLIALAILGTAVVASIQAVSQGLRLLKVAGDQQRATAVADQRAREVVVPIESADAGQDGRFGWTRVTRVIETPELTPGDAPPKWRVFETTVAVTWDEDRRVEVTSLQTVRATSDATRDTTGRGDAAGAESSGAGISGRSRTAPAGQSTSATPTPGRTTGGMGTSSGSSGSSSGGATRR
jgi:prepilin-type N-terminal cleavage/methylation domain-containing protein